MILSDNFNLKEFTKSATALRLEINNKPDVDAINNIQILVDNLLQPLRDKLGPIRITSGYRNQELCLAIGSSKRSQHTKGQAVDIQYFKNNKMNNKILMRAIIEHGDFDQLINEFNYSWIHVSYKCAGNRNQILKAYKENNKTVYADITNQYNAI